MPDARYMNVGSGPQVQQLLFAGATKDASKGRGKAKEAAAEMAVPLERVFKVRLLGGIGRQRQSDGRIWQREQRLTCRGAVGSVRTCRATMPSPLLCLCPPRPPQVPNVDGLIEEGKKAPKKNWDITLHSVWGPGEVTRLQPEVYTPAGGARERCRRAGRLGVAACCVRQLARGRVVWQMHVQACSRCGPSFSLTCRRARLLHSCAQVAGGQGGQGAQEAGGAGAGGGGGG